MSRRAVIISVAAHGVAIAVIATFAVAPDELAAVAVLAPPTQHVTIDDVVEVVLLPEPPVERATPRPAFAVGTSAIRTTGTATIGSAEEPVAGPQGPDSGNTAVGGPSMMRMRGTDLTLPDAMIETVLSHDKPPEHIPESGRIEQRGRTLVVPDLQVPATIGEDGTVTFHDKPAADIHWRLHLPSKQQLGDMLANWYADPYAQTYARPWQEISKVDQAVEGDAGWDSEGTGEGNPAATLNEKGYSTSGQPQFPIAGGTMDVTSWAMRKFHVGDPYASRKRKLLADTFDERAAIGARNAVVALDRSSQLMQKNVVRLWAGTLPMADKQAALFELWDECTEGEDHAGQAGTRARAIVLSFIRSHAALTPAQVDAFDARRVSNQHFAPYAE